jgi:hypothetical protein
LGNNNNQKSGLRSFDEGKIIKKNTNKLLNTTTIQNPLMGV